MLQCLDNRKCNKYIQECKCRQFSSW